MSTPHVVASLRWLAALVIVAALAVQAWADLTYGTFTWVELPGYFTPLAALTGVVALVAAAVTGPHGPRWVSVLRMNAATYLVIVGAVYWTLLADMASPMFPWANLVLHGGAGLILLADWLLLGEPVRLPVWSVWTVVSLPAVWLAYLGVRAGIDGWLPYAFLDPANGVVRTVTTMAVIFGVGLAVAGALRQTPRRRPWSAAVPAGSATARSEARTTRSGAGHNVGHAHVGS